MAHLPRRFRLSSLIAAIMVGVMSAACNPSTSLPSSQSPQDLVDELLAADRAASGASAATTVVPGLTAMFTQDVVMPAPGVGFAQGLAAAADALSANADNASASVDWTPIRGGVSADGLHGFTFGFMTLHLSDGSTTPLKYLAYWVKRDGRWQVAAYKRRRRAPGDVSPALMAAALPAQVVPASTDRPALDAIEQGLVAAEQGFSDDAQRIGLGPAFAKHGSADAMNMGGPDDAAFVIGADAISRSVTEGQPFDASPFNWSAESVIVASSGDLGVTIGYIRLNQAPGASAEDPVPEPFPFFTIWRRENPTAPWRYVAE